MEAEIRQECDRTSMLPAAQVAGRDVRCFGGTARVHGFQAIDSRSTSETPDITTSDLSGWQHRGSVTFLSYLRFHPLLTTWLVVLVFVVISSVIIRLRRRPVTPYVYTVPWKAA